MASFFFLHKQVSVSLNYLAERLSAFLGRYSLVPMHKMPAYTKLFELYVDACSPVGTSPENRIISGKFLAVFYWVNENFLKQENCLQSPNFLAAKEDFMGELVRKVVASGSLDPEGQVKRFSESLATLWKEMTLESAWFGGEWPALDVYKKNREVTILVHEWIEMWRLLFFPQIAPAVVCDSVSLVAQIVYYDNDLRSKHDAAHGKPNLLFLFMRDKKVDASVAKEQLLAERQGLCQDLERKAAILIQDLGEPGRGFVSFLLHIIEGNNYVMDSFKERYGER